jgi:hypothetical protein
MPIYDGKTKILHILLIDDNPGSWPSVLSDFLLPIQCDIEVMSNDAKTIKWAENITRLKYQLIICNLLVPPKIMYGKEIIKGIRANNKKIPIFVITNFDGISMEEATLVMNELSTELKVNYYLFRYGDKSIDIAGFRKHVLEDVKMNLSPWIDWEWESTDKKILIPKGVIRDVLLGLEDLPNTGFSEDNRDDICILAELLDDRRVKSAVSIWNKLWLEELGLPFLSYFEDLVIKENSGQLYKEYRDHSTHSVWLYLLGLYLYNQCQPIREAINNKYEFNNFLRAWKIAALFHDVGYSCDVGISQEEKFLAPLIKKISYFSDYPLLTTLEPRGFKITITDEEEIARSTGRFRPGALNLSRIESTNLPGSNERILSCIESLVLPACLSQGGCYTPLSNYYDLAKTVKSEQRDECFRDHGILSAILLLYQYHRLDYSLKITTVNEIPKRIPRETARKLNEMISSGVTEEYKDSIYIAAAAMALHNVNVDIWDIDLTRDLRYSLSLNDFKIDLNEMPIAFLLAITDRLQCWDRPKKRYVQNPKDFSILSRDVHIFCEDNMIKWQINRDTTTKEQLLSPIEEIKDMSKYLSINGSRDLSQLIIELPPT